MTSELPNAWWVFVSLGLCAGVLSGALGLGSGIVFVPALVILCGFAQKSAQGTALAVMVPMALVGAIRYWRNPDVEMSGLVVVLIALGAVVGALAGTELAARLPGTVLRRCFAIFLLIGAVKMFPAAPKPRSAVYEANEVPRAPAQAGESEGEEHAAREP